ncbi:MAG TPA: DUF4397 domain-containing protein [Burkholderiaceae bacterium]
MRMRSVLAGGLALVSLLLSACGGGGSSDGQAQVRLINMSAATSLDVYDGTSKMISSVGASAVSDYAGVDEGSYTVYLKIASSSTSLLSQTRSWSKDTKYTLLAYERYGAIKAVQITENQSAPSSGAASVNFYNLATDAGALDVYVTDPSASLTGATATKSGITAGNGSGYVEIGAGTYRIRVTAAGDKTDVRLDIPSVTLADQQIATLGLTGTTGGVLVDGVLSTQAGSVSFYRNTNARVRVVAALTNNAIVTASADSTSLASALQSTTIGAYVQVAAGTPTVTVTSNGTTISSAAQTLSAGYDYTLLVYGDSTGTPQSTLLVDDNRISDTSTSYAKVRLVHAVVGLDSALTMLVNSSAKASSVAYGTGSDYASLASTSSATLTVLSPSDSVYSATDVTFASGATYTLFMLGTSASPRGLLIQDH